jgi:hypothetical protein
VVALKFHLLICEYVFGIATACLQMKVRELGFTPAHSGTASRLLMQAVNDFLSSKVAIPSEGLTLRQGAGAPLHALTMIGMATIHCRDFSWGILPGLANLFHPQYIMQFVCFTVWGPRLCGFGVLGILSIECIGWLLRRSEAVEVDEIAVSMKAQAFGNCCTPFIFVMMAACKGRDVSPCFLYAAQV